MLFFSLSLKKILIYYLFHFVSISGIKSEAAGEQIGKIQKWREVYKEVDMWYHTMSAKVEENFTMGKTLPVVQQQIAEQEVCFSQ